MKFLESNRIKKLTIGAAEDTSRVGLELQFSVCKDKSNNYIPTKLRHGGRHQVSRQENECPPGTRLISDIHTHPIMNLGGKGSLQSQARLSDSDILFANKLNKIACVAQKVKKTNEVVVKCITPKSIKNLLSNMYRGNPTLEKNTKNDEELLSYYGRKMMFSEEKSKPYIKEKRFKLNDIISEKPKKSKKNTFSFEY